MLRWLVAEPVLLPPSCAAPRWDILAAGLFVIKAEVPGCSGPVARFASAFHAAAAAITAAAAGPAGLLVTQGLAVGLAAAAPAGWLCVVGLPLLQMPAPPL